MEELLVGGECLEEKGSRQRAAKAFGVVKAHPPMTAVVATTQQSRSPPPAL